MGEEEGCWIRRRRNVEGVGGRRLDLLGVVEVVEDLEILKNSIPWVKKAAGGEEEEELEEG